MEKHITTTTEYVMLRKNGSSRYVGNNFSLDRTDAEMTNAMRKEFKKNNIKGSIRKHTYSGGMTISVRVYLNEEDILTEDEFKKNYEVKPRCGWIALAYPVTVTVRTVKDGEETSHQETFVNDMNEDTYYCYLDADDQKKVRESASMADYKEFLDYGESWRSGNDKSVILTEKGIEKMNLAYDIIQSFNYDDSDIYTDYFDNYFWTEMTAVKKF